MQKVNVKNSTGRHTLAEGEIVGETKTLFKIKINKSYYTSKIAGDEIIKVKKMLDKNYVLQFVS